MRETIECLRPILTRRTQRLRRPVCPQPRIPAAHPLPHTRIGSARSARDDSAGGAVRRRGGAQSCFAAPGSRRCAAIEARPPRPAATPPHLTVWVPVAVDPVRGRTPTGRSAGGVPGPPGYGEMFCELGFADLVQKARAGTTRRELAAAIPVELLDGVCALGSADRVEAQLRAYHEAGADCVAVVPSTAEDPAVRATLRAAMTAVSTNREI